MTEIYDTDTLKAIIVEAKRQGFDDKIIALNIGIARDNPAFGYEGDDQLRASVSELYRRGIHFEGIAEQLGLSLAEVLRLHGDDDLHIGIWGGVWSAHPGAKHHPDSILCLIERGQASLIKATHDGKIGLLRNPSRNESLALLVDGLGLNGARDLIARFLRHGCNADHVAVGLHIPEAAVLAVALGSFPTSECAPTLQ